MRIKLLFCFFIITIFAGAQTSVYHPFPDSNATWNIHCTMFGGCGPPIYLNKDEVFTYTLNGDTLLNGQRYHKVFIPFVQESCSGSSTGHYQFAGYRGCLREDTVAQKVYFVYPNDSIDSLLYDFTLQVGDTIKGIFGASCFSMNALVIDSIDSVLVAGNYRKRWNYGPFWERGEIIEGIGSLNGLLEGVCDILDAPLVDLTCFKQNNIILYTSPSFPSSSCDIIDGIPNEEENISLEIFPNPATNELRMDNGKFKIEDIEIYDVLGQSVFNHRLTANSQQITIDVSQWKNGMYFAHVKTEKGIVIKKFIKQ